ncbi:cobalamin biosynthesis protein CobD [Anopheles sinensis]|uniref:Cobalamin biosynthesis protein CobD n=1 Tax=Anopheles sinensis TaxID=74873 RepID=A0A084VXZ7_ANOSI|nr:cobalamin biosynthesis protein CobD [Anopheles sinensis]
MGTGLEGNSLQRYEVENFNPPSCVMSRIGTAHVPGVLGSTEDVSLRVGSLALVSKLSSQKALRKLTTERLLILCPKPGGESRTRSVASEKPEADRRFRSATSRVWCAAKGIWRMLCCAVLLPGDTFCCGTPACSVSLEFLYGQHHHIIRFRFSVIFLAHTSQQKGSKRKEGRKEGRTEGLKEWNVCRKQHQQAVFRSGPQLKVLAGRIRRHVEKVGASESGDGKWDGKPKHLKGTVWTLARTSIRRFP